MFPCLLLPLEVLNQTVSNSEDRSHYLTVNKIEQGMSNYEEKCNDGVGRIKLNQSKKRGLHCNINLKMIFRLVRTSISLY